MVKEVKRVTKQQFEDVVEDKATEGYKLKSKTDRQAIFVKHSYGGAGAHILIFLLTFWWTFGLGNLIYLAYNYTAKTDEIQLKITK